MRLDKILQSGRVALDSNIFIYFLENNPDFLLSKQFFSTLPESDCLVYTSVITLIELTVLPFRQSNGELAKDFIEFLTGHEQIKVVPVNQKIALQAAQLRADYRLKTPDAIQLATAILSNAEYFLTADRDYKIQQIEKTKIVLLGSE